MSDFYLPDAQCPMPVPYFVNNFIDSSENIEINPKLKYMVYFDPLFEFSRQHCIGICTFLVPANLLASLFALIYLFLNRSIEHIRLAAFFGIAFATIMFLHVSTWMAIGVITPVTFILFTLGMSCLVINLATVIYTQRCQSLLQLAAVYVTSKFARL